MMNPGHFFHALADAIKAHAVKHGMSFHALAFKPKPGADPAYVSEVLSNIERWDMVLIAGETLRIATSEHADLRAEVETMIPALSRIRTELYRRARQDLS